MEIKKDRLKYYRKLKKMTQKELADQTGLSTGTIQQYELGKRNPKYETLCKIAEVLDLPVSYFIDSSQIGVMVEDDGQKVKNSNIHLEKLFSEADEQQQRALNRMLAYMEQLNNLGLEKALDQVELLTEIKKYKKEE